MIGPVIYKVAKIGRGGLSVMAKPTSGEWIDDEFTAIHIAGVTHVLSLLETNEAYAVGLDVEEAVCIAHGMDFTVYAIPDRGIPSNDSNFVKIIKELLKEIRNGTNLVVHCRAGIGRTGLVAAAILIAERAKSDEAFAQVSAARGVEVPDTDEQKKYVQRLYDRLQIGE